MCDRPFEAGHSCCAGLPTCHCWFVEEEPASCVMRECPIPRDFACSGARVAPCTCTAQRGVVSEGHRSEGNMGLLMN